MTGSDTRDLIKTTWPVVAMLATSIVGITLYAARVEAKADKAEETAQSANVKANEFRVWLGGPPPIGDRLARMEENQLNMQKTLERIEQHQIEQDRLTMQRRGKLSGL